MKSNRRTLLLLAVLAIPALLPAAPRAAEMSAQVARGHGLLWEVQGKGYQPSYIFGTMHIADPRVTKLAPAVQQAFDHSRSFVMEVLMDYGAYARVVRGMFFNDGRTLKSVIGADLFQRVAQVLARRGFSRDALMNMKPWAVMSAAGIPGLTRGTALDLKLFAKATKQGKKVYGLETADEQLAVFDGMPRAAQIEMVRGIVRTGCSEATKFKELLAKYLARDLNGLMKLGQKDMAVDSPAFALAFNKLGIADRNVRMVERMQPRLREGRAFIAVGALHLPGRQGVLHLLEQQGFTVTPIY